MSPPTRPAIRGKQRELEGGRRPTSANLPILHRAEWVIPVTSPPIRGGAVWVKGDHVLTVGPYAQMKAAGPSPAREVDHGSSAILPGLVNAHTHLELSGVHGRIDLPRDGFTQWLRELFALRPLMTEEFLKNGMVHGQRKLADQGCCLCGDITNGACLPTNAQYHHGELQAGGNERLPDAGYSSEHSSLSTHHSRVTRQVFLEVLGFDREGLDGALNADLGGTLGISPPSGVPLSLAAHACYSTSASVIRGAKEWCRTRGLRFSMHVAEHLEEIEFLEDGTGFCREILENLGRWVPQWIPPKASPVNYLEQLRVLDSETLLVHAVHLTDADWEIVCKNRCSVCFCPRSNRYLNIGQPDIGKALRLGLVTALGTDSLASNTDLNLFAEAAYVLDHYPDVSPEAALLMITLGGARALGQERHFGAIQPEKRINLLAVSLPASLPYHLLFETIIQQGNQGAWQWV